MPVEKPPDIPREGPVSAGGCVRGRLLRLALAALVRFCRAANRFFTALSVRPPISLAISVHCRAREGHAMAWESRSGSLRDAER